MNSLWKKTFLLLIGVVVFTYVGFGLYLIRVAGPFQLFYATVYGEWEYFDSLLLPLPLRSKMTLYEIESRSIKSYDEGANYILTPYAILGFQPFGLYNEKMHWKKIEYIASGFLARGMPIDKIGIDGCTSLQRAIMNHDLKSISFLRSNGASELEHLNADGDQPCSLSIEALTEKYNRPKRAAGQ